MKGAENSSCESHLLLPSHGGFLQFDVQAGHPDTNMATVAEALARLAPPVASLVVLPELWAAGFVYDELDRQAEATGTILDFLIGHAGRYQICLAGSLPEKIDDGAGPRYFNTLFFCGPDGLCGSCRKQQLFAPMAEDRYFTPGDSPRPVAIPWGRVAGLVCFDLRFPQLAAAQVAQGAAVIAVSAQWPAARAGHWRTLLQARAIENQAYVIGCNRCGSTGSTPFAGHSIVIAPDGTILAEAGEREESGLARFDPLLFTTIRARFQTASLTPYRFHDCDKICTLANLLDRVDGYRRCGRRMVFTNGCFDILHEGHVTYLEAARRQGDYLVVGMNSDSSISRIKGPKRPVNSETSRARLLAALGCVDHVVVFSDETPLALITALLPDVLVKGADWPVEKIIGAREVMAAGGEVKTIELVGDFSTTALIEKIRNP
ncbi:MAG: D-glycero-beta-D-manno-heptose 1-phosphate adenylyltransferase [Thermodesulfobacteriota bacterium]